MFKYVALILGLLIMCVPEEASTLRFIFQGGFGAFLFSTGVFFGLNENQGY